MQRFTYCRQKNWRDEVQQAVAKIDPRLTAPVPLFFVNLVSHVRAAHLE